MEGEKELFISRISQDRTQIESLRVENSQLKEEIVYGYQPSISTLPSSFLFSSFSIVMLLISGPESLLSS